MTDGFFWVDVKMTVPFTRGWKNRKHRLINST